LVLVRLYIMYKNMYLLAHQSTWARSKCIGQAWQLYMVRMAVFCMRVCTSPQCHRVSLCCARLQAAATVRDSTAVIYGHYRRPINGALIILTVPKKIMTTPSERSTYAPICDEETQEEETVFVTTGSENCIRASPTRFVDTTDSCCLCSRSLECDAQVRLKCGHQYHLGCYMRHARQNEDTQCIKCQCPELATVTSPIITVGNVENRLLQQFASRAFEMLQSRNIYSPTPSIEST